MCKQQQPDHWTPLHLQLMLHYHTSPSIYTEHEEKHAKSEAVSVYRIQLVALDLLIGCEKKTNTPDGFMITDKGRAFVRRLCNVQQPEHKWI